MRNVILALCVVAGGCAKKDSQAARCGPNTHEEHGACVADRSTQDPNSAPTPALPAKLKPTEDDLVAVFAHDLTQNGANPFTCDVCTSAGCEVMGFKPAGRRSFLRAKPDFAGRPMEVRINVTAAVVEEGDTETYPYVGKITYACTGNKNSNWGLQPMRNAKTYQFAAKSQKWRAQN